MGSHPMGGAKSSVCSTIRDIHIEGSQVWFACGGQGVKKYDIKRGEWKEWKFKKN
jgi:frataxin-like iron-binding protein CyaY